MKVLDLFNSGLGVGFPSCMSQMTSLISLNLSKNGIGPLDNSVCSIPNLQVLFEIHIDLINGRYLIIERQAQK